MIAVAATTPMAMPALSPPDISDESFDSGVEEGVAEINVGVMWLIVVAEASEMLDATAELVTGTADVDGSGSPRLTRMNTGLC